MRLMAIIDAVLARVPETPVRHRISSENAMKLYFS